MVVLENRSTVMLVIFYLMRVKYHILFYFLSSFSICQPFLSVNTSDLLGTAQLLEYLGIHSDFDITTSPKL